MTSDATAMGWMYLSL